AGYPAGYRPVSPPGAGPFPPPGYRRLPSPGGAPGTDAGAGRPSEDRWGWYAGPGAVGARPVVRAVDAARPSAADPDRVRDHQAGAGRPPADPHHRLVPGGERERPEGDPLSTVAALVDVDGVVTVAGDDHVRGVVVVARVRRPPGVHLVGAGPRNVDPVPGRVAGEHRLGEPVVRAVPLLGVRRHPPVAAGAEPGAGGVH